MRTNVVDSYKYAALVVSRVVADGYLQMVKTIPQLYRYVYQRAERATEVGPFRTWAHQFTAGNLRELMVRERPDVVVCTHAFPCGAMAEYKNAYADAPPVVGIVTDFAVHAFWVHHNVDGYAVADESVRAAMIARGARPERILASGIPIDARFAPTLEPRRALRERLSLPLDLPLVLMMGGGLGMAPLAKMLGALDDVGTPIGAVVVAGPDPRQERRILAAAEGVKYPVRVLRFVDNVYDYMHACDAFVTKPGGLSVAEALAARIPIVIAPAMNTAMLEHPATVANLRTLEARGVTIVAPESGFLAERETGAGRLAGEDAIMDAIEATLARTRDLAGERVLITAGPTREPIDPVRFLSNASTGTMGIELAREALARGATVDLVLGPTSVVPPSGAQVDRVTTAREMERAALARAPGATIAIATAAVADWRPAETHASKVKKTDDPQSLALERNPDILAALGARKNGTFLVGFAAETNDVEENARAKLKRKKLDMIAANQVGDGLAFDCDDNALTVIWPGGKLEIARAPKLTVARELIAQIAKRLPPSDGAPRRGSRKRRSATADQRGRLRTRRIRR